MNLGAFCHFFRNDRAAYEAVRGFRLHHPTASIHIISDAGDDFSKLASEFGCSHDRYEVSIGDSHEKANLGLQVSGQSPDQHKRLGRMAVAFMHNLRAEDWIVLLEPDVETLRTVTVEPEFSLAGGGRGPTWSKGLKQEFAMLGERYTGCGGSCVNREDFLSAFHQVGYPTFSMAYKLDPRIRRAQDACHSFLIQVSGRPTGEWSELGHHNTPDGKDHAFIHGNKQFYNQPSPL